MASQKKDPDRTHPMPSAGQRVGALEDRLAELRSQLEGRVSPVPPAPSGTQTTTDIERLASLVFNALKGDPVKLRQLVHALGQLEAKSRSGK